MLAVRAISPAERSASESVISVQGIPACLTMIAWHLQQRCAEICSSCKGAFTPDAYEALRAIDLHVKSMQRRD